MFISEKKIVTLKVTIMGAGKAYTDSEIRELAKIYMRNPGVEMGPVFWQRMFDRGELPVCLRERYELGGDFPKYIRRNWEKVKAVIQELKADQQQQIPPAVEPPTDEEGAEEEGEDEQSEESMEEEEEEEDILKVHLSSSGEEGSLSKKFAHDWDSGVKFFHDCPSRPIKIFSKTDNYTDEEESEAESEAESEHEVEKEDEENVDDLELRPSSDSKDDEAAAGGVSDDQVLAMIRNVRQEVEQQGQDKVQPDLDPATPVKKLKRNFTYEGVKVSASPPKKPKKIVY